MASGSSVPQPKPTSTRVVRAFAQPLHRFGAGVDDAEGDLALLAQQAVEIGEQDPVRGPRVRAMLADSPVLEGRSGWRPARGMALSRPMTGRLDSLVLELADPAMQPVLAQRTMATLLDAQWEAWALGLPAIALADEAEAVLSRAILGQAVAPAEFARAVSTAETLARRLALAVLAAIEPPRGGMH